MLSINQVSFDEGQEQELIDYVTNICENDDWRTVIINECQVTTASSGGCGMYYPDAVRKTLNIPDDCSDEAIEECLNGKNTFLIAPRGNQMMCYPIPEIGFSTFSKRAGFERSTAVEIKPDILNEGFPLFSEEAKLLYRDGFALVMHSSKYSVIRSDECLEALATGLPSIFGSYNFVGGSFSNERLVAKYTFPNMRNSMLASYNNHAARVGEKVLNDAIPAIMFETNDIAECGVNLHTMIIANDGKLNIRLGEKVSLPHLNGNSIAEFNENISKCFSLLQEGTKRLEKLLDVKIEHPLDCFKNICNNFIKSKIPTKELNAIYEDFEIMAGDSCTAHHLFLSLYNVIPIMEESGYSVTKIMVAEETLDRLIRKDFKDFDKVII